MSRVLTMTIGAALCFVLVSSAWPQTVDGWLDLGDVFKGSIDPAMDVDVLRFEGIAGEKVTVSVKAKKKGASGLKPYLAILDVGSGVLVKDAAGGTVAAIEQVTLPTSGLYELRVSAASNAGKYILKTDSKIPKGLIDFDIEQTDDPEGATATFVAKSGWKLKGSISPAKGSPAIPGAVTLEGEGFSLDLEDFVTEKGKQLTLKKVSVPMGGAWVLRVLNQGQPGPLDIDLKLVLPKKAEKQKEAKFLPAAPSVDSPESPTAATSVLLSGEALEPGSTIVAIVGDDAFETTSGADRRFELAVTLLPNQVNPIHVHEQAIYGPLSAPAKVEVIHDNLPPTLTVEAPLDGATVYSPKCNIVGRVDDLLSDGAPVAVRVLVGTKEIKATVAPGAGSTATFIAEKVPLVQSTPPVPTAILVKAMDVVGNESLKALQVTYQPATGPVMTIDSGDGQSGKIGAWLKKPMVVKVADELGAPIPGRLVTFRSVRNDAALAAVKLAENAALLVQVETDADGRAKAWLRLGSEGGVANNRVEATATGVAGSALFCASGVAKKATRIHLASGDAQRAEALAPLPDPLRVWVSDGRNGVGGEVVVFKVIEGGGSLEGGSKVKVESSLDGYAEVGFELGAEAGVQVVEATFPDNEGLPVRFTALAVERVTGSDTTFVGEVRDNARRPLRNATVTLLSKGAMAGATLTDGLGRFLLDGFTVAGPAHLEVDGSTVDLVGGAAPFAVPPGTFPKLSFMVVVIPSVENRRRGPILLPPLDPANQRSYSTQQPTVLSIAGVEGVAFEVAPSSMSLYDPATGTTSPAPDQTPISLNQVHVDDIPMPFPDGAKPPFAWTLQPSNARFDPPVMVQLPNMDGRPAGELLNLLSFDHDLHRFVVVASARVSDDGAFVESLEGDGLAKAGWGGSCPPYPPTTTVTGDDDGGGTWTASGSFFKSLAQLLKLTENPCWDIEPLEPDEYFAARDCTANASECAKPVVENAKSIPGTSCSTGPPDFSDFIDWIKDDLKEAIKEAFGGSSEAPAGGQATVIVSSEEIAITQPIAVTIIRAEALISFGETLAKAIEVGDAIGTDDLAQFGFGALAFATIEITEVLDIDRFRCEVRLVDPHGSANVLAEVSGQAAWVSKLGGFSIPNVPVTPGSVIRPTVTYTGVADEFQIAPAFYKVPVVFGTTAFGVVPIDGDLKIPAGITAATNDPILTAIGQTTVMQVTATFDDGSSGPVNGNQSGTTYTSSNSGIATVSGDGVVTALAKGCAFLTARNEGATAVVRVDVLPGDPLTTVTGVVRYEDGSPAALVRVASTQGSSVPVFTGIDGRFEIPGVASQSGVVRAFVRTEDPATVLSGHSLAVEPIPSAVTDLGTITLHPPAIPTVVLTGDSADGTLRVLALDGTLLDIFDIGGPITTIAMDVDGNAWIGGGNRVRKIRFQGGFDTLVDRQLSGVGITRLVIAPDGELWIADSGNQAVHRLTMAAYPAEAFATTYETPIGLAIAPDPNTAFGYRLWYTSYVNGPALGELVRLDPATGQTLKIPLTNVRLWACSTDHLARVWLPVEVGGSGSADQVIVYDGDGNELFKQSTTQGGTHMTDGAVTPDAHGWSVAGDGHSDSGYNPAFLFHFGESGGAFTQLQSFNLNVLTNNASPRGVFVDALGKVWAAVTAEDRLFVVPRDGSPTFSVDVGDSPVDRGDPTGYVQAYVLHPQRDFDGDGISNLAELQAGTNPFAN